MLTFPRFEFVNVNISYNDMSNQTRQDQGNILSMLHLLLFFQNQFSLAMETNPSISLTHGFCFDIRQWDGLHLCTDTLKSTIRLVNMSVLTNPTITTPTESKSYFIIQYLQFQKHCVLYETPVSWETHISWETKRSWFLLEIWTVVNPCPAAHPVIICRPVSEQLAERVSFTKQTRNVLSDVCSKQPRVLTSTYL